jgi:hypothetical protein
VEGPGTCLELERLAREMLVIDFKGISTNKLRLLESWTILVIQFDMVGSEYELWERGWGLEKVDIAPADYTCGFQLKFT